jgi:citrate synthase
MADNNRIQMPGTEQPVNIEMTHAGGFVQMMFNPPITRMRLRPREARALAVSMLLHADQAEYPEPKIEGGE